MGFLDRFRGKAAPSPTVRGTVPIVLSSRGWLEVVGEASYQPELERLAGGRTDQSARVPVVATLATEPTNRHDPNAVAILVAGCVVGYLSREQAVRYKPLIANLEAEDRIPTCSAVIVGGWSRPGDHGHFGIYLHLAEPHECVMRNQPAPGERVTAAEHTVKVTREEHYQAPVQRYGPGAWVWATLRDGIDPHPKSGPQRAIEVQVDGDTVGFLTPGMSERYALLVREGRIVAVVARIESNDYAKGGPRLELVVMPPKP